MRHDRDSGNMSQEISTYLKWLKIDAPKARFSYAVWLARFNKFAKKDLKDITESDIKSFFKNIHKMAPRGKKRFSENSVCNARAVVRAFITYWYRRGYKLPDPETIDIGRDRSCRYASIDEGDYAKALSTFRAKTLKERQDELIIRMLWETGARANELCNLCIIDLDINNSCAYVQNTTNTKRRWLVWSGDTNRKLRAYLRRRVGKSQDDHLFVSLSFADKEIKGKINPRYIQRLVKRVATRAGIDTSSRSVVPHGFRSHALEDMVERGHDVEFIQQFLGYSTKNDPIDKSQDAFIKAAKKKLRPK